MADADPLAKLNRSSRQQEKAVGALYQPQEGGNRRLRTEGFLSNVHQETYTHDLPARSGTLALAN